MIYGYSRPWPDPNSTEALAFQRALNYLPHSDAVAYVGFPWAELFTSIDKADQAAPLLTQLQLLTQQLPDSIKRITVCHSPALAQHSSLLLEFGITDIFWSHCALGQKQLPESNIRVWPFPLCPLAAPLESHRLIQTHFSLLPIEQPSYVQHLWQCVNQGIIPLVYEQHYLPPGNPGLWQQAVISLDNIAHLNRTPEQTCAELLQHPTAVADSKNALSQLRTNYGNEFLIFDIVEYFFNPELFINTKYPEKVNGAEHIHPVITDNNRNYCLLEFMTMLMLDRASAGQLINGDANYKEHLIAELNNSEPRKKAFFEKTLSYYCVSL